LINLCYLEQADGAPEAVACYEKVRTDFRGLGGARTEAVILNNLGGVYDALGEPDSARACYDQALALRRVLGDREGEAWTLGNIANISATSPTSMPSSANGRRSCACSARRGTSWSRSAIATRKPICSPGSAAPTAAWESCSGPSSCSGTL